MKSRKKLTEEVKDAQEEIRYLSANIKVIDAIVKEQSEAIILWRQKYEKRSELLKQLDEAAETAQSKIKRLEEQLRLAHANERKLANEYSDAVRERNKALAKVESIGNECAAAISEAEYEKREIMRENKFLRKLATENNLEEAAANKERLSDLEAELAKAGLRARELAEQLNDLQAEYAAAMCGRTKVKKAEGISAEEYGEGWHKWLKARFESTET